MLNDKQTKFLNYYLQKGNATEAAKLAGYSEKTAYSIGQRLLNIVEIRKAIEDQRNKSMSDLSITSTKILGGILNLAESSKCEATKLRAWLELAKLKGLHITMQDIINNLAPDQYKTLAEYITKNQSNE